MKNIIKSSLVALVVLSLASCGDGDKAKSGVKDSTTVKVDSGSKTTVDSTTKDTVKKDSITTTKTVVKKDSVKK